MLWIITWLKSSLQVTLAEDQMPLLGLIVIVEFPKGREIVF